MLSFFPDPYPDEILYSTIARYHYYVGNVDYKDTLLEIFGANTVIPTVEFPSHLGYLAQQFSEGLSYTSEYFIRQHTLFPIYEPFLPRKRQDEILDEMKFGSKKGIYTKVGMVAGSICVNAALKYCPLCCEEDVKIYGESFFRRTHQVQGIYVCHCHGCTLKLYPLTSKESSRLAFIRLDHTLLESNVEYLSNRKIADQFTKLAKAAYTLLNQPSFGCDQEKIHNVYINLLQRRQLVTMGGQIKQSDLSEQLGMYYGTHTLKMLESSLDNEKEYNWLKVLTRKPKRVVHLIRNLLLIQFLCGGVKEFFQSNQMAKHPFGNSPYYCLNPVAEHFKKKVVTDCKVTADYKTRQPVGTFSCSCGFIYSRKDSVHNPKDSFKVGRIKQFGHVWESHLIKCLEEREYGQRELARDMGCDPKTVLKFAYKHQLHSRIHGGEKVFFQEKSIDQLNSLSVESKLKNEYRDELLSLLSDKPELSRKQLRDHLDKQYMYLYRHDRQWLEEHLPKKRKMKDRFIERKRVDWEERDKALLLEVEDVYMELLEKEKPVRITKSIIGTKLGKLSMLEKNPHFLLKTNAFLSHVVESVEEFQKRRIEKVFQILYEEKSVVKKWEVKRKAGLRSPISRTLEEWIDKQIEVSRVRKVSS